MDTVCTTDVVAAHHAVVAVRGDIDLDEAIVVRATIASLAKPGRLVELHLDEVTFLGSRGLQALLQAAADVRAAGGDVAVTSLTHAVDRLLTLTMTRDLLIDNAATEAARRGMRPFGPVTVPVVVARAVLGPR